MAGGSLTPAFGTACGRIAAALAGALDPWWVIGSAAVALHGADPGEIGDVDVLLGVADAEAVYASLGIAVVAPVHDPLFRSTLFARWGGAPLPVELMAGLTVRGEPVVPATRVRIEVDGMPIFVPERAELAAILRRFGRAKDLARAAALTAI